MNLFSQSKGNITYQDIISFCEQGLAETTFLDYKENFPKGDGLEKTISAFANTYGGILVIGVSETKDGKPSSPFSGINYLPKLEEKVWQIILNKIYPPVFPEITVCPREDNEYAFVVIRVPQSDAAPHSITGRKHVYIRTGNLNSPEENIEIDRLKWLWDKRKQSEDLRQLLRERSERRFERIFNEENQLVPRGFLSVSISPHFPHEPMLELGDLWRVLDDFNVRDESNTPIIPSWRDFRRNVQDGIVLFEGKTYADFNRFGLIFYKRSVAHESLESGQKVGWLLLSQATHACNYILEFVRRVYEHARFWGLLDIECKLENCSELFIQSPNLNPYFRPEGPTVTDPVVSVSETTEFRLLLDRQERNRVLSSLLRKLFWGIGQDFDEAHIRQLLENTKWGQKPS